MKNFMEKKEDSMERTCISSSNLKNELLYAKKVQEEGEMHGQALKSIKWEKYKKYKTKRNENKIKRLQVRLNLFHDDDITYKTVKTKGGGGYRYIKVNPSVQVSFKGIQKRAFNLLFDQNCSNKFKENEFNFICSICNKTGFNIYENIEPYRPSQEEITSCTVLRMRESVTRTVDILNIYSIF